MRYTPNLISSRPRDWFLPLTPRFKLTWVIVISALACLVDSRESLVALLLMGLIAIAGIRMEPKGWLLLGLMMFIVVGSTVMISAFFIYAPDEIPLFTILPPVMIGNWEFPGLSVKYSGIIHGLFQAARIIAPSLAGIALTLSTSTEQLLSLFRMLHVPNTVSFSVTSALRFIPSLIDEYLLVKRARWLRGAGRRPGERNWVFRIRPREEAAALSTVLVTGLRRARQLAAAVGGRGFDAHAPRTDYPVVSKSRLESTAIALMLMLLAGVFVLKSLTWIARFREIPTAEWSMLARFALRWL